MSVLDATEALDVAGYAAAVRRSLVGLGPEQVEDLTDDLEADLADALADERHIAHGRGLLEQFGPPEEYAAELRAAAGLASVPTGRRPWRGATRASVARVRRGAGVALERLRAEAWWAPAEGFVVALRPIWWLVRGWVAYQVAMSYLQTGQSMMRWLPSNWIAGALLAGSVLLSVQWGRGVWFQSRRIAWLAVVANLVAIVALVPVVVMVRHDTDYRDAVYDQYARGEFGNQQQPVVVYKEKPVNGVVVDGMQVSNLFAYDAAGNPLSDVQIFDDRGRPVRTTYDGGTGQWWFPETNEPWSFVSRTDADGRNRWNVYPLRGAPTTAFTADDTGKQVLAPGTTASIPPRPFAKAPALDAPTEATIGAEAAPTP